MSHKIIMTPDSLWLQNRSLWKVNYEENISIIFYEVMLMNSLKRPPINFLYLVFN